MHNINKIIKLIYIHFSTTCLSNEHDLLSTGTPTSIVSHHEDVQIAIDEFITLIIQNQDLLPIEIDCAFRDLFQKTLKTKLQTECIFVENLLKFKKKLQCVTEVILMMLKSAVLIIIEPTFEYEQTHSMSMLEMNHLTEVEVLISLTMGIINFTQQNFESIFYLAIQKLDIGQVYTIKQFLDVLQTLSRCIERVGDEVHKGYLSIQIDTDSESDYSTDEGF